MDQERKDSQPSLIAYVDGAEVFRSSRKWLHPLLELSRYLHEAPAAGVLTTYDRVVGRAGALISARLGITRITTDLVSARAIPVLEHFGIGCDAGEHQDRLLCVTEDLLSDSLDPEHAYELVLERAQRNG